MADSWLERKKRMVRCKVHGLHYDPKLTSGCVRCRKEQVPKARSPQLAILLLLLMGIVFVFMQLLSPFLESDEAIAELEFAEETTASAPTPTAPAKLDPEAFRAPLESLESTLFRSQVEEFSDLGENAGLTALSLTQELRGREPGRGAVAADAIEALFGPWREEGAAPTFAELEAARTRWVELRGEYFQPASWFASSTAAPGHLDRASLLVYRELATELEDLIFEGRSRLEAPSADEDLSEWSGDWRTQIAELETRLPARPGVEEDAEILAAVQKLERTLSELRRLAAEIDSAGSKASPQTLETLDLLAADAAASGRDFDDLLAA